MILDKKVICIIPAKKKSVGLKNKNFKLIKKKPLYVHSIEFAKKCKIFDKIVVSSDSEVILKKAKKLKVTSLKRPTKFASSDAQVSDVIIHVLKNMKSKYSLLVLLQPTTPIISIKELEASLKIIAKKNYNNIIAIKEGNLTIEHLLEKKRKNLISHIIKKKNSFSSNRQFYKNYYRPSGDFYICKVKNFLKTKSFYSKNCYGFLTRNKFSVDINHQNDLDYLNFLLRRK
jgi:CMP-N,N'-diacetyllegionaminic acid synthase